MIYLDTETCGLCGPAVLIQWARDEGPIELHDVFNVPIWETIELIELFTKEPVCMFNATFDWFQLCKLYTMFSLVGDRNKTPSDMIEELALLEAEARDGPCLKPLSCIDVMLHARKGPYQSTMQRDDIRIKRVPTKLAWPLARELESRIPLKEIYFAKRKVKGLPKWQIYDIENELGDIDPNFKDIVLKFNPSSALKTLAADALQLPPDEILLFADIELSEKLYPVELGYAPFCTAIGNKNDWKGAWPEVIKHHIDHWSYHELARKYASKDVSLLRSLYYYFDRPIPGDVDSELACMAAAVRWKGFTIDVEGIKELKAKALTRNTKIVDGKSFAIPTAPAKARLYITSVMGEIEKSILEGSTKKTLLEDISKWSKCLSCGKEIFPKNPGFDCTCKEQVVEKHPAAIRAKEVLDARQSNYEADFYSKLLTAGRFHASMSVIGALSGRMSGGGAKGIEQGGFASGDGLNAQGVKRTKEVRSKFTLGINVDGGDFSGFEVSLAEAVYNDSKLRADLKSGKKIHALFGQSLFPHLTYEQIVASAGTSEDFYEKGKRAFFAKIYGGNEHTLKDRIGIDVEDGARAIQMFEQRYLGVAEHNKKIFNDFCSMRQPEMGGKVYWNEPKEYVETMLGFRRYFTLENKICKALYQLACDPPQEWRDIKIRVQRRANRIQTASGACQSALFGAAFAIQGANLRAANNHEIQALGAQITKIVQAEAWKLQPSGINNWIVQMLNIHDEILSVTDKNYSDRVEQVILDSVESFREKIPLIKMDWKKSMKNWGEK